VGGINTLKDKKAAYLFHDAANARAPKLAEASRSGRSLRDIELNLASLHEASDVFLADATPKQKKEMTRAFAEATEKLTALEALKDNAPTQQRLKAIRAALNELDELGEAANAVLPAATGLSLGFNNLDGD
ncbi:MAG TPA: imelysin family protein, partial [Rhizomicrobium sp.]